MALYPLKFKTIFKDKIWGGNKIRTVLGKDYGALPNCGETWEISGVEGNISVVENGALAGQDLKSLIASHKEQLVGHSVYQKFGNEFPLLVKFIDANDDLSIQVHPDDELAKKRHNSFGKTEMWYIMQADVGAKLITGFNQPLSPEKYEEYFNAGNLLEVLNQEDVKTDDVYFLPAGRVHTIGKGLLLAEIQQTSDVTYRIYDFDRKDAEGNTRELHVEEALDAIDYNHYDEYKTLYDAKFNDITPLVGCEYFQTNKLQFDTTTSRDYSKIDSFVINVCLEGSYTIKTESGELPIKKGEAALIPACIDSVEYVTEGGFSTLESIVP